MKRSEVIKYIYHSVKVLDDYNRFEEKELMEFSEKLLNGLEGLGMRPPLKNPELRLDPKIWDKE